MVESMKFCEIDDRTVCDYCGSCGITVCREIPNAPCDDCGYCEYGGVIIDHY
jgi:hypothetical protein